MNKNIIIGIVVLVLVVGALFLFGGRGDPIDVSLFGQDETELNSLDGDINMFVQDDAVLDEIDDTVGDITDAEDACSVETIDQEAAEVDLTATLDAFDEDETILNELDQIFGEVSL